MTNGGQVFIRVAILILCFLALSGCASAPADFQSVLQNLSKSYPNIWRLATATAYVLGFFFGLKALYQLKIYGEMRTMMSSNSSIKTPLTYLLVSTALIFSPTAFQVINYTFFATPSIMSYTGSSIGGWTRGSIEAVIGIVQIIGLLSFIRGWIFLARGAEQSGQPGQMGKAMTHIIGGALAINIVQVKEIIWNSFGFGG